MHSLGPQRPLLPVRPARGRASLFAAGLLTLALLLGGCDLFGTGSNSGNATATVARGNPDVTSGGSLGGPEGATVGAIETGGTLGGPGGAAVGSQPTPELPQAAGTQTPSGTIGGVEVQPATPTSAAAAVQPAGVAFSVPQDSLNVAGRLAYVGNDHRIWTMAMEGTDWRVLIERPTGDEPPGDRVVNLNVSPSGKRILYTVLNADSGAQRHYMLDLNTGQVTRHPYAGAWSPDSSSIATSVDGRLIVYNVETGAQEAAGDGTSPSWTADRHLIVFREGNVWILEYPANPGADRKLTNFPGSGPDSWQFYNRPVHHYSGRILFAGAPQKDIDANGNGARIMSVDRDGAMVTLANPKGSNIRYLDLAPSGTRLAYSSQTTRSGCVSAGSLHFVNAAGGGEQQVAIPEEETNFAFMRGIAWSPDQRMVYSYTGRSCASGAPVDTTGDRLFLVDPAAPGNPRYIGDGSFPAFIRVWALGHEAPGPSAGSTIRGSALAGR